ncbi:hypothetical protein CERSUDRAFT_113581 [Gelatoporia subvermispora B]|uniref:Kynureninase n=1 Tax=Ceriporiopsis subvermispora (strain B) TaxID=914234 RepID=M2R1Q3_CERS8|nr:hypothetical protein CERSUDRAFT_113581 [Gelatoporia subvermispora B]
MPSAAASAAFVLPPEQDPIAQLRDEFAIPTNKQIGATAVGAELEDEPCTYMAGNSLGLMPKRAKKLVQEELDVWSIRAVEGHFDHPYERPWVSIADNVTPLLAEMIGAKEAEVACMSTLTANLHLMLNTFYRPTKERFKILCEAHAFPSDQYAFASQVASHGFNPKEALIELPPRTGEYSLREEDILDVLALEGESIALVLFPGVQYYTGQVFSIQAITKAAKEHGCICGWDLAHAVGNVPLALHDWNVDFAVWCTYKYLNSGPGGISGLFVHESWNGQPIRNAGWWGHDPVTRFDMPPTFSAIPGAQGFQQSNPSVLTTVALLGSLQVFKEAGGMAPLRARSVRLTGYLDALIRRSRFWVPPSRAASYTSARPSVTIITPIGAARGSQLSLLLLPTGKGIMQQVLQGMKERGVLGDSRKPDVIRLAPCALYNSWGDVERAVAVLEEVLDEVEREGVAANVVVPAEEKIRSSVQTTVAII